MTSIYKKVPAVVLAVFVAAALLVTMGISQQSFAASSSDNYTVFLNTFTSDTALPGGNIGLEASYESDSDGSLELTGTASDIDALYDNVEYKWELTSGSQYAKIKPNPGEASAAWIKFKETADMLKPDFRATVTAKVTLYADGVKKDTASVEVNVASDYTELEPQVWYGTATDVGDSCDVQASVVHFWKDGTESCSEVLDDVHYEWAYDPTKANVTGGNNDGTGDGSAVDFTVERLSGEEIFLMLEAYWGKDPETGDYQNFDLAIYDFEELPTDLSECEVEVYIDNDSFVYLIDEMEFDLQDAMDKGIISTSLTGNDGGFVISKDKYEFNVYRYVYDPKTGEDGYVLVDPSKPLPLDEDGSACFVLQAVAKGGSGYDGKTKLEESGYLLVSNRYAMTAPYSTFISFNDAYANYVYEDGILTVRYEVHPGTELTPSVTAGDVDLDEGVDYKVSYVRSPDGMTYSEFPDEPGIYEVVVQGIDPYFGVDRSTQLKVANNNPVTAKAKTITYKSKLTKKNKTKSIKTFKASSAVKVSNAVGGLTYKKVSGSKMITIAKDGKVTVKKGTKKGTYKIGVKVTAAGDDEHFAGSKTVTFKVKVKKK